MKRVSLMPLSFSVLIVVIAGGLFAATSNRCLPVTDCDGTAGCTWMDRTFPAENVCVNVVLDTPDECKEAGVYGWNCTDSTTTRRCVKRYWNYIGQWGGASNCTTDDDPPEYGPSCGEEELQFDTGRFVPDTCTESAP